MLQYHHPPHFRSAAFSRRHKSLQRALRTDTAYASYTQSRVPRRVRGMFGERYFTSENAPSGRLCAPHGSNLLLKYLVLHFRRGVCLENAQDGWNTMRSQCVRFALRKIENCDALSLPWQMLWGTFTPKGLSCIMWYESGFKSARFEL